MFAITNMLGLFDALNPQKLLSDGGPYLLFAIIFAESGLLIGFFLPGDSLLFTAGAAAGGAFSSQLPDLDLNIWLIVVGCFIAAVSGDQVGYFIGRKVGPKVFKREDSRFFKQSYVGAATGFFEKYGGRAIVLARFVPVVRTFVPTVAGVSRVNYALFIRYNIIGALIWAVGVTMLGYWFGQIDAVKNNIELSLLGFVVISFLPIIYEVVKARRESKESNASV